MPILSEVPNCLVIIVLLPSRDGIDMLNNMDGQELLQFVRIPLLVPEKMRNRKLTRNVSMIYHFCKWSFTCPIVPPETAAACVNLPNDILSSNVSPMKKSFPGVGVARTDSLFNRIRPTIVFSS